MNALKYKLSVSQAITPLLRTASVNGTGLDLANYLDNLVVFNPGAITDGTFTPKLQDSADNSTWADVAAADQVGTLSALAANTMQSVSYIGSKRYIRAVITASGSPSTGGNMSATLVGKKRLQSP